MFPDELLETQRGALVTFWLASGEHLSVGEISGLLGMTPRAADRMLQQLSVVLPFRTDSRGRWFDYGPKAGQEGIFPDLTIPAEGV